MGERYIVTTDKDGLILEKLANIEDALAMLGPLLTRIIAHLEAQTKAPMVPVASYDELYTPIEAGPPEGEVVADMRQSIAVQSGGWRRLFAPRKST